ncbi:MAG: glucosamine-6-phosphate deaminase [Pirellulaceae bacterium]|nr:glucosamine-6-phosphate deaminase [Planctomycetales bacterium]
MRIHVSESAADMGALAAELGAAAIRAALAARGEAVVILATGASQFEPLQSLASCPDIDWARVHAFHLDEYLGLGPEHGASFRKFLRERFVAKLPTPLGSFTELDGKADPSSECRRVGELISRVTVDVAFIGIGENGHLAFNDPPADFTTTEPYRVVDLDEACRRQQLGEGWFESLEAVPRQALSMSIREILRARKIICSVPDERKSAAVQGAIEGPLTPDCPASALRVHGDVELMLDRASASLLQWRW